MGASPYHFKTFDPKLVRLAKMPLGILNIPFKFRVLGDEAGDGKMEVTVETEGEKIPTELEALGEGTFEVTFMGDGERRHELSILFNGEHIPDSPMSINFADVDKIRVQPPKPALVPCNRELNMQMTSAPSAIDDLVITILGPVYNSVPYTLRNHGDRLYSIDWLPLKPGTYDFEVKYGNAIPVWGCPMKIEAFDSTKVKVIDRYDEPKVGQRHLIKVDVSEAGAGDLTVIIMNSEGTVQSAVDHGMDDLLWVTFDLEKPDLYDIYIAFNGEPVPGSPFKLNMREFEDKTVALPSNTKYFIVQDIQWCFLQSLGTLLPYNMLTMYITGCYGNSFFRFQAL
ncbi:filamin-A-like [Mya arenaria]|uniref:filamin-A-like n=1 Tax=Mya arenaria TaxID=6604 RepID=UPI0022E17D4D|nr:filamin-A-like [Mya arenaria]